MSRAAAKACGFRWRARLAACPLLMAPFGAGRLAAELAGTVVDARVSVYLSPRGGATAAVLAAVDGPTRSIRVHAYLITSGPIIAALERAHLRGVVVAHEA